MRFVHTADWHIGAGRSKLPDGEYLIRQMTAINEVVSVAEQFSDGVILVSGDIFDRKLVLPAELNALLALIDHTRDIQWIITNGNHDITEDGLTNLRALSIMARNMPNVHVAELHPQVIEVCGVTFVLYPPWQKHSLDSAEAQKDIARYIRKRDLTDVVVSTHFSVQGSITETGWKMKGGTPLLGSKRVGYWALGDIHRVQQVAKNAWYCGNPIDHKWGEQGDKGCLVVDSKRGFKPRFHAMKESPRFVVLDHVPAERPGNALCQLRCPMSQMPLSLPDWIISTDPVLEEVEQVAQEVVERSLRSDDPLDGLQEVLSGYDLEKSERRWCETQIRRAIRTAT